VYNGDEGQPSEAAFLRDFAGDLPDTKAHVLYAVQEPFQKALLTGKTEHAAWRLKPSFYAVSTGKVGRSTPTVSASWLDVWAPRRLK